MNTKLWAYGLFAAVIGGGATAVSNFFVLPRVLNNVSMHDLWVITGWNVLGAAVIAAAAYLKTHPLPEWDGVYKRINDTQVPQGTPVNVVNAATPTPVVVDGKDATKP